MKISQNTYYLVQILSFSATSEQDWHVHSWLSLGVRFQPTPLESETALTVEMVAISWFIVRLAETVAKPVFLFGLRFDRSRSAASGQVCYVHAWLRMDLRFQPTALESKTLLIIELVCITWCGHCRN